jgi:hypothetical protein
MWMVSVARKYCYIPGGCCDRRTAQAAMMSLAVIMLRRKDAAIRRGVYRIGYFLRDLTSTEYSAKNAA